MNETDLSRILHAAEPGLPDHRSHSQSVHRSDYHLDPDSHHLATEDLPGAQAWFATDVLSGHLRNDCSYLARVFCPIGKRTPTFDVHDF
jgi:hypothetical protein